jgi:hypothetical protein
MHPRGEQFAGWYSPYLSQTPNAHLVELSYSTVLYIYCSQSVQPSTLQLVYVSGLSLHSICSYNLVDAYLALGVLAVAKMQRH